MNDNTCDGLLGLLMLGGMFFFGKKQGEKKTIRYYEDSKRDEEIKRLQQEINTLKSQSSRIIS